MTKKSFKFAAQYDLDFHFVSAADGTNVVKVWQTHSFIHTRQRIHGREWPTSLGVVHENASPCFASPYAFLMWCVCVVWC